MREYMLFFSGGTALRELSAFLKDQVFTVHLVTPFDSGGSSAEIRKYFQVFALGDLRNRLLSLMQTSIEEIQSLQRVLSYRLAKEKNPKQLWTEFRDLVLGTHWLLANLPLAFKKKLLFYFDYLFPKIPLEFNLAGASLGNLFLLSVYLYLNRDLEAFLSFIHEFLKIKGVVRPVVKDNLDLISFLETGEKIIGQHKITAKEGPPLNKRIVDIKLFSVFEQKEVVPTINLKTYNLVKNSSLIVYPMGSFFSSILCCLLPKGVKESIKENKSKKIFIPNLGKDPELYGYTLTDQLGKLKQVLDAKSYTNIVNVILLDKEYSLSLKEEKYIKEQGVEIVRASLVSSLSYPYYDALLLGEKLLYFLN